MPYYTASSVQKELMSNKKLEVAGKLECPRNQAWIANEEDVDCCRNPQQCIYAPKRECKQRLSVSFENNKTVRLTPPLSFSYTISKTNTDGCIDAEDSSLDLLIRHGLIKKENLKLVA